MADKAEDGVHQLVLSYGRERAREMVDPKHRSLVDIAAEVLSDEQQKIGISYTGFCLTSLPHKKLEEDEIWERTGHNVTLIVEPGSMKKGEKTVKYGVPYGARARLILLYLQTEAVKTNSREIALGRSMRNWMERMSVPVGGETARSLREQAARISACSLKFFWKGEDANGWTRGAIVSSGLQFRLRDERQDGLWDDRVILDEFFWKALKDHPVPLQEVAIQQLAHRSLALDIYVWMAWRCHHLQDPVRISWTALNAQFGVAGRQLKYFKPMFMEALRAASAAYPGSRTDGDEKGITLYPAKPPVLKLVK